MGSWPAPGEAGLAPTAARFSSRRPLSACLRALFFLLLLLLFLDPSFSTWSEINLYLLDKYSHM